MFKEFKIFAGNLQSEYRHLFVQKLLIILKGSSIHVEEIKMNLRKENGIKCPYCGNNHIIAIGKLKGIQRFRCKGCAKNFSETKGTPLFAIKKTDLLENYIYCMLDGKSIRESAIICGIAKQTSQNWRHKILAAFKDLTGTKVENPHLLFSIAMKQDDQPDELFKPVPQKTTHPKSNSEK